MQGLAASITPVASGRVLITISGTIISSAGTINDGIIYQISHGTGSAPANAAALTGTQVGAQQQYTNPVAETAADIHVPFSIQCVVTGLSLNVAHWIDLAAKAITGSAAGFTALSVSVIEF